jgi:hypothetical protein
MTIWYGVAFNGAVGYPDVKHHSLEEAKTIGNASLAAGDADSFAVFEVDDRNGVSAVGAMHSVFDSRGADQRD